jgi:hypothetical protein
MPRKNNFTFVWRTHSCVQRRHSCRRLLPRARKRRVETRRGRHECLRHGAKQPNVKLFLRGPLDARRLPVFPLQALDSGELTRIRRNEDRIMRQGYGSNHQVVRPESAYRAARVVPGFGHTGSRRDHRIGSDSNGWRNRSSLDRVCWEARLLAAPKSSSAFTTEHSGTLSGSLRSSRVLMAYDCPFR